MLIRAERPREREVVDAILETAFGGRNEAEVVRGIRQSPGYQPHWSLVAAESGSILGHVLFSHVGLEDAEGIVRRIVVLAPLAVLPEEQRRGVGSALVRHGLELLESASEPVVVLRAPSREKTQSDTLPVLGEKRLIQR